MGRAVFTCLVFGIRNLNCSPAMYLYLTVYPNHKYFDLESHLYLQNGHGSTFLLVSLRTEITNAE